MKIFFTILALLIATPVSAVTLWDYYSGNIPSIEKRALIYDNEFSDIYEGTYEQNINFLPYLQYTQFNESDVTELTLGSFRPSNYVGKLLTRLNDGGAESTFNTTPDEAADGTGLSTSKLGDFIVFTINPGASNEEKISVSAVATSSDEATWTIINRGLSFTENVSLTANIKQHAIGETVIISNDDHYLTEQFLEIGENQTITAVHTFNILPESSVAPTTTDQFTNKNYVDNVAVSGAATSTATLGGIVRLATAIQAASTTDLGVNDPLVLPTTISTSSPDTTNRGALVVVTNTARKIVQAFLDLTENFTWTGAHDFTSSTTTVNRLKIDNGVLEISGNHSDWTNAIAQGVASSSVPATDGSGNITYIDSAGFKGLVLLQSTTTQQNMIAATSTVDTTGFDSLYVEIELEGKSSGGTLWIQFNGDANNNYGWSTSDISRFINRADSLKPAIDFMGDGTLLSTTSPAFLSFDVDNQSGERKFVSGQIVFSNTGSNAPRVGMTGGVWNNTSSRITDITLSIENAGDTAITSGTVIRVWGKQ